MKKLVSAYNCPNLCINVVGKNVELDQLLKVTVDVSVFGTVNECLRIRRRVYALFGQV